MTEHVATVEWARGDQAFADNRYSRAHDWTFDGGDHLSHGDLVGRTGQAATALRPALSLHDAGMTKVRQDRLKELRRKVGLHGHPLGRHSPMGGKAGQFDNGSYGVFGSGTDLHIRSLSFNGSCPIPHSR